LISAGDLVLTSHVEPTASDGSRGRFYVNRVDVSDPASPRQLPKLNVPGALVSFDARSGRAITSEQQRVTLPDVTYAECMSRFALAE